MVLQQKHVHKKNEIQSQIFLAFLKNSFLNFRYSHFQPVNCMQRTVFFGRRGSGDFSCSDDHVISSHTVIANSTYSSGSYQSILSLISNKTIHGPQSNQCIVSYRISEHQVKPLLRLQLQVFFCAVNAPLTAWWAAPTSLGNLPLQFSASQQNKCIRDGRIKFQPSSELTTTAFCPQIRFIIAFAKASCSQQWVFRWHVLHVIP